VEAPDVVVLFPPRSKCDTMPALDKEVSRMSDLKDLLSRPFLFGLGAMALTGDRIRQFLDESVARGEITREQGSSLWSDIMTRAEEERRNLEVRINEQVRKALQNAGLVTKGDLELLRARIDAIENRLARIEGAGREEPEPEATPTQPEPATQEPPTA
jgi:polyhydroxyalkanoate synthesis regulator phasin